MLLNKKVIHGGIMDWEDVLYIFGFGAMYFLGTKSGEHIATQKFIQNERDRELLALREEIEILKKNKLEG